MNRRYALLASVALALGLTSIVLAGVGRAAPPSASQTESAPGTPVTGLRPLGIPLEVALALDEGDSFTLSFGNCPQHPEQCIVSYTGGQVQHRGWLNLAYVWNQTEDPGWRRAVDPSGDANVLKDWMANGFPSGSSFYAGDYVHAKPGRNSSAIGQAPIGERILVPVFDSVPHYDEIPAPKAPAAAQGGSYYYHIVGFVVFEVTGADQGAGTIDGRFVQFVNVFSGTKTVEPAEAGPGDTLVYTVVVSNAGPGDEAGLRVVDPIPWGTVYIWDSAWASGGLVHPSDSAIRWTGYLTAGHVVTLGFQVYVDYWVTPGNVVTNTATVVDALGNSFDLTATTLIHPVEPRPWTFLVYLSADNNMDNQRDRLIYDLELFNNLERAAARNPGVTTLVQWDRSPDHAGDTPDDLTRRYRVLPDRDPDELADYVEGTTTWDLGELNMGDGQTLSDFVTWARSAFTPTTYTALSLVGHGGGWAPSSVSALEIGYLTSGMGWDDTDGDYLGTREIGDALYRATDEGTSPIDVLFLDASMMGMLENAYEVRDSVRFLVASESAVWSRFPYEGYVGAIGMDTMPRELAEAMVRIYDDSLLGYPRTMAGLAVDVSAVGPISQALDSLALALSGTLTTATRLQIVQAYSAVQKFDSNWDYALAVPDAYVDLYDLAEQLATYVTDTAVLSAAHALTAAVGPAGGDVVVQERHHDGQPWVAPSQTWTFTGAHGLAIYFPLGEDLWIRDYYRPTELDLAAHTHWDEFLHLGWYEGQPAPALPPGTLQFMSAAGLIDPALRPGLLPVKRFLAFLPCVTKSGWWPDFVFLHSIEGHGDSRAPDRLSPGASLIEAR